VVTGKFETLEETGTTSGELYFNSEATASSFFSEAVKVEWNGCKVGQIVINSKQEDVPVAINDDGASELMKINTVSQVSQEEEDAPPISSYLK